MKTFTIIILAMVILSGCSQKYYDTRNIKRLHTYNYMYPGQLAIDCSKWFPVKDSMGQSVHPANNIDYSHRIDSLNSVIDSLMTLPAPKTKTDSANYKKAFLDLKQKFNALKAAYKPCKPDTIPHYIENTAKIRAAQDIAKSKGDSLQLARGQITQLNTDKSNLKSWIWRLAAILGTELLALIIWGVIKIYKLINGVAVANSAGTILRKL